MLTARTRIADITAKGILCWQIDSGVAVAAKPRVADPLAISAIVVVGVGRFGTANIRIAGQQDCSGGARATIKANTAGEATVTIGRGGRIIGGPARIGWVRTAANCLSSANCP